MTLQSDPSQRKAVLHWLMNNGSITQMEAIEMFGATRLSAIIFDLRKEGYPISTEMVKGKTRFGRTTRYAVYRLARGQMSLSL